MAAMLFCLSPGAVPFPSFSCKSVVVAQCFGGRLPTLPLPTALLQALLGTTGSASGGFGVAAEAFPELPSAFGRRPCRSPLMPKGSEDPSKLRAEDGSLAEVSQQRLEAPVSVGDALGFRASH
ncbi:unnamed protein product, partial [Symbiodinium sp. CCMP2592]